MRIPVTVSLRFPPAGKSAEGEAAPKARPKGVVDGYQVNIPVLLLLNPWGTHRTTQEEALAAPRTHPVWWVERST